MALLEGAACIICKLVGSMSVCLQKKKKGTIVHEKWQRSGAYVGKRTRQHFQGPFGPLILTFCMGPQQILRAIDLRACLIWAHGNKMLKSAILMKDVLFSEMSPTALPDRSIKTLHQSQPCWSKENLSKWFRFHDILYKAICIVLLKNKQTNYCRLLCLKPN